MAHVVLLLCYSGKPSALRVKYPQTLTSSFVDGSKPLLLHPLLPPTCPSTPYFAETRTAMPCDPHSLPPPRMMLQLTIAMAQADAKRAAFIAAAKEASGNASEGGGKAAHWRWKVLSVLSCYDPAPGCIKGFGLIFNRVRLSESMSSVHAYLSTLRPRLLHYLMLDTASSVHSFTVRRRLICTMIWRSESHPPVTKQLR